MLARTNTLVIRATAVIYLVAFIGDKIPTAGIVMGGGVHFHLSTHSLGPLWLAIGISSTEIRELRR
jgi:hypothetical protein